MRYVFGLSLLFTTGVIAYDVVPHDSPYFTQKVRNTELIYTQENLPFAQHAAEVELELQPLYEKSFDYVMDETLYVGLISKNNQIANGFSTQYPNNRQINYIGGALSPDYFCATSWLDTLLYHETAHNYQLNAKDNKFSSSLHSVIGNGSFFLPWFSVPNITESSFLLEGNAVLNESWHGNGGRLYSGRFKIATLMQAKAGKLTPQLAFNDNYEFLYGSHFYTLGGFYSLYLGETYGLEKLNSYWKTRSRTWYWPFLTNRSMQRTIGVNFEDSFHTWADKMEEEAKGVVETHGEILSRSQFYQPLNRDESQIYFITNKSGRETPSLNIYNKKDTSFSQQKDSYIAGKVVKVGEKYFTQGSAYTSPWRIHIGLFDEDAFLLDGTKSKAIQGYLSDGRAVYFDVPKSYRELQLYIGDSFYNRVNSSVIIDKEDNLYYFKQDGKTRTLYKNKTPLYSYEGYYGIVSDVDSKGGILFVANTQLGSGLYRYKDMKVQQMNPADTIIDAKYIDDTHALVAVMGSDEFTYEIIPLKEEAKEPYVVKLFVEDKAYYQAKLREKTKEETPKLTLENKYYSVFDMHYSGTDIILGSDEDAGFIYNLSVNFADPLTQNALSVFVSRNIDEITLAGASYTNTQYFLQYSVSAYSVLENDSSTLKSRDYGLSALAVMPFVKVGYYSANLQAGYFQDYESDTREPLSLKLDFSRQEHFGVSAKNNFLAYGSVYATSERDDKTYGAYGEFEHELPFESYINLHAQYSKSDAYDNFSGLNFDDRGVKVSGKIDFLDNDPSKVLMPSIKDTLYVANVAKVGGEISLVSNYSAYFFTFPISLRREIWSLGYNYYDLELRSKETSSEIGATLSLDTLWFNVLPLNVNLAYYYNDNQSLADENTFRATLGLVF